MWTRIQVLAAEVRTQVLLALALRTWVRVALAELHMRAPAVMAGAQTRVVVVPRTRVQAEPLGLGQVLARVQWQRKVPLSARPVARGWGRPGAEVEQKEERR